MDNRKYILEAEGEGQRLERQSRIRGYLIQDEMEFVKLPPTGCVLDAGCGTGLVSREVLRRNGSLTVEACDFSPERVAEARKISGGEFSKIRFFEASLDRLPIEKSTYNLIICRYVFQHLPDPLAVAKEFYRATKEGGAVTIIDLDGMFFNFHSDNKEFIDMLELIKGELKTPDLFVGRKLKSILLGAGFTSIECHIEPITFAGESLIEELKNTQQRLAFAAPRLLSILGSPAKVTRFSDLYCQELMNPTSFIFYDKFVVTGQKGHTFSVVK